MEGTFAATLVPPREANGTFTSTLASPVVTQMVAAAIPEVPADRPCECGKGIAFLGLPIGSATPRWCLECPNKAWNAIKRCECRRKKARFGLPGQELKDAVWCADCPGKSPDAINLEDAAATARVAAAKAADAARFSAAEEPKPCVCGKSLAILALPIQAKIARWCPDCPDRPRNAIPVAGRCQCGRRKASLGMPDSGPEGAKWCDHCPDKPSGLVVLIDHTPVKIDAAPRGRYSQPPPAPVEPGPCVCGKETATMALPIQLWLAKWCPSCPERPRNAVNVKFRCECGRRKASLGMPGEKVKWCMHCPNKPEDAVSNSEAVPRLGEESASSPAKTSGAALGPPDAVPVPGTEASVAIEEDEGSEMCVCGSSLGTMSLPAQASSGGKWCPLCPDLPRNAVTVSVPCRCGKQKACLGIPEDYAKGLRAAQWCPACPDVPPHVINFRKRPLA